MQKAGRTSHGKQRKRDGELNHKYINQQKDCHTVTITAPTNPGKNTKRPKEIKQTAKVSVSAA